MRIFRHFATSAACAVSTITLALAQDPKPAPPVVVPNIKDRPLTEKGAELPPRREDVKAVGNGAIMLFEKAVVEQPRANMALQQQAADDALMTRYVQIYTTQFRPILSSEINFVRAVCAPTKEQRTAINRDGADALSDAVKQYAEAIIKSRRVAVNRPATASPFPDPRYLVQVGLTAAMRKHLTAEQLARYQEEVAKRNADRKDAAIQNLIVRIDQDLFLTADQRAALSAEMAKNWNENWLGTAEILVTNPQLFPQLPDLIIRPVLGDAQRKIWDGTAKYSGGNAFGFGRRTGVPMMPELLEDDEERVKEPLPPKPAPEVLKVAPPHVEAVPKS